MSRRPPPNAFPVPGLLWGAPALEGCWRTTCPPTGKCGQYLGPSGPLRGGRASRTAGVWIGGGQCWCPLWKKACRPPGYSPLSLSSHFGVSYGVLPSPWAAPSLWRPYLPSPVATSATNQKPGFVHLPGPSRHRERANPVLPALFNLKLENANISHPCSLLRLHSYDSVQGLVAPPWPAFL